MHTFTIPKDKFPSKKFDVVIKEPQFKDRRVAFERHPGRQATYTVQELLLASCLSTVNGVAVPDSRDVLDNLKGLPHKDGQFLLSVFMSLFQLDDEEQKRAKDICQIFYETAGEFVTIDKEDMPTKQFSIAFRLPTFNDRRLVTSLYPKSEADSGYSFEELFFSNCLTKVGATSIQEPNKRSASSSISVLDHWSLIDVQFALTVFLTLTSLDQKENDEATDLGKSLRMSVVGSSGLPDSPTVQSSTNSRRSSTKSTDSTSSEN